jgi:hypothetical protein
VRTAHTSRRRLCSTSFRLAAFSCSCSSLRTSARLAGVLATGVGGMGAVLAGAGASAALRPFVALFKDG